MLLMLVGNQPIQRLIMNTPSHNVLIKQLFALVQAKNDNFLTILAKDDS